MTFRRHPGNPILTRASVPDAPPHLVDVTSVFNPGVALHAGQTHLLARVQTRGRETFLLHGTSGDGLDFRFADRPAAIEGLEGLGERVYHVYDPRIVRLDGSWFATVALDLESGCRSGLLRSDDLERFTFLGGLGDGDGRNAVLFPERIGGRCVALNRPNRIRGGDAPPTGDAITLLVSEDLRTWEARGEVLRGRPRYWDELVGAGPPPVKTREGWLLVYHGVATHFRSVNIYQAGVVLLDLEDPLRVLARGRNNVLEPRESWELTGQVPNVVFPTGAVVVGADDDGFAPPEAEVRLYYGAADTCIALATASVAELLAACRE